MRTFSCKCGAMLFFHSTACVQCGVETRMCPSCELVVPLEYERSSPENASCGNPSCGAPLRQCRNDTDESICNRGIRQDDPETEELCDYCRLTRLIPDLSIPGNRDKWRRLEQAKQRVLYGVDSLGLPIRSSPQGQGPALRFEFKSSDGSPVHTGHQAGCITINIREADDVEREKTRVAFGEPQRTLVGTFRHELGHYFWERLVKPNLSDDFRSIFGDERDPSYSVALQRYHEHGAPAGWNQQHISAYATMHPWEDFAETFNAYLDIVAILNTAEHFEISPCPTKQFDEMLKNYQHMGLIVNEFNRDMGITDLVPEVLTPRVIEKLHFVDRVVQAWTTERPS